MPVFIRPGRSTTPPTWSSRAHALRLGRLTTSKVESPIVASHDVAWRVFEIARLNQREADLPADRVGCCVGHGGKGVEKAARLFRPSHGDRLCGSRGRDATALEGREHRPAHLVDLLVPPGARPVADRA